MSPNIILHPSRIGGVKKAPQGSLFAPFFARIQNRVKRPRVEQPVIAAAPLSCEEPDLSGIGEGDFFGMGEGDGSCSQSPSGAGVNWDSKSIQHLMSHIRHFIFLPSQEQVPVETLTYEALVSQPTVYAPKVFTDAEVNAKLEESPSLVHFSREEASLVAQMREAAQLSQCEAAVVKFITGHGLSEKCGDDLLQMLRSPPFSHPDISHDFFRTYKTHVRGSIPSNSTYAFKTAEVFVGKSFENKLKLVDHLGQPIKIVYRNPFNILMRHWMDPMLKGKIYLYPQPQFLDGQRMFSNFGNG
jgi:hypothetical protein